MDTFTGSPGQGSGDDPARQLKDSAASLAASAEGAVKRGVEVGAERVAGSAQNLAATINKAADAIQDDNAWFGNAMRKSADGLQRATQSISNGDLSGVLHEVNGFARRQPAIFLGACVALGFAAARVGKTAIEQNTATSMNGEPGSV